ncbi:hypothetical protein SLS60_008961 [Paraconiothyrium brasiliense]|uniref:DUF3176 domain containing protein n=1 Tax=Paraconiothyrium brasiliense TaxID=300254 RepID=A0ABR3QVW6_9PLEO
MPKASNFAQRIEQKLWSYTASGNVVKRWLIEIISWSLSAACMAGIGVMLIFYHDKAIPKWPLGLTLNAYISVLAKVASAALMLPVSEALGQLKWSWFQGDNSKKMWDFELFDSASRGPWGSFLLLVRTKGRSLAALGAAVTLFALALDPFFQQVVEYPEVWRVQPGKGAIPRAYKYFPFSSGYEYLRGTMNMELDQSMLGVTYHYFYSNGTAPTKFGKGSRAEVPLGCPSSNCTWPVYETFGVHSECTDATDKLEFKCRSQNLDWVQAPIMPENGDPYYFPNGTSCGWWLKADKPVLMTGYDIDRKGEHAGELLLQRSEPLYDVLSREFMPGYTPKLNNSRNPLAHVVIAAGESYDSVRHNATPIAHECLLSWAAKKIKSEYSEGGYTEEVVEARVNTSVTGSHWLINYIPNDNPLLVLYDYNYMEPIIIESDNHTTYTMDNNTHLQMVSLFDDVFPSYYTIANSTNDDDALLRYKRWKTISPLSRNMSYNPFMHANISTHLDRLSTTMTNVMRSNVAGSTTVEGTAFDKESIVEVRWAWLSLPLGLLAFTGIFLLATVIRSSREQDHVGVWKTSAIATLMYGLPDKVSEKMTASKEHGTPRAKAKEMKVKWVPAKGWRLSGNSISPTSTKVAASPTSLKSA